IILLPVVVALVFMKLFNIGSLQGLWQLMTLTFFISLPYLVGVLTIFLSRVDKVKSLAYRAFMPWVPIFLFFVLTLILSIEGWACWLMILPIFLLFASLGGLTAGYFKVRKSEKSNRLHLSLAVLLPFVIGPIEKAIGEIPGFYTAYTYIDIDADKENIWSNVTRVRAITKTEDQSQLTNFMQIPRPIKAELDFEGVGASREAIFDGGLIFHEKVLKYEHQKLMSFSIRANTYEIPSTTFDEHVLIGGEFFDVLQGTYKLEPISKGHYRLHLSSEFKLNTTFNFYASIWGRLIMKDIQNNILKVIKQRSELPS
ncbi:MAG TPA: hypothetical protein DGG95_05090, partial [Cytophagales bacterium]|nr:hypothetical protein [Cytophagales bacterium]